MKDYILDLDRPRALRYGFKAMRVIRKKFGDKSPDQLMDIKVDEMPVLAWAGLTHEDKNLTVDQLEVLMDEAIPEKYTILAITTLVLEALAAQMGVETKVVPTVETLSPKAPASAPETILEAPVIEVPRHQQNPKKMTPSTRKRK